MAFFTRSSLMRPTLNKLLTNSVLVEPEQYHAMEKCLFVMVLNASRVSVLDFNMQIYPLLHFLVARAVEVCRERRIGTGRVVGLFLRCHTSVTLVYDAILT